MAQAFPGESLWLQLRQTLKQTLPPDQFLQWIQPLKVSITQPGLIVLTAPTRFHLDWLKQNYLPLIRSHCHALDGAYRIEVQLAAPAPLPSLHQRLAGLPLTNCFQPSQTFDNYIVASFNHFAFVAARAICRQRPLLKFNPLFIEGPPAIGKTHLLQAIGNTYTVNRRGTTAYLSCRDLETARQRQLSPGSQGPEIPAGEIRVLMFDDIHLAPRTVEFQSRLLDIFNWCYDLGTQMVFSANRLPHLLAELPTALRSRLSWGLIARIHEPDLNGCHQVVEAMLGKQKSAVSRQIPRFLSKYGPLNFHEIKKYADNLKESVNQENIPPMNQKSLALSLQRQAFPEALTPEEIKEQVCATYNVTLDDLVGSSKRRATATARQVGMYLARKLVGSTYSAIGESFGSRDHSTVIHACRKVQAEIKRNRAFLERVVEIERKLYKK